MSTSLIINTPFEAPRWHWSKDKNDQKKLTLTDGRRPAGYEIFDTRHNTLRTENLDLVNTIRERWNSGVRRFIPVSRR
jgi:type III restriction enzyme